MAKIDDLKEDRLEFKFLLKSQLTSYRLLNIEIKKEKGKKKKKGK